MQIKHKLQYANTSKFLSRSSNTLLLIMYMVSQKREFYLNHLWMNFKHFIISLRQLLYWTKCVHSTQAQERRRRGWRHRDAIGSPSWRFYDVMYSGGGAPAWPTLHSEATRLALTSSAGHVYPYPPGFPRKINCVPKFLDWSKQILRAQIWCPLRTESHWEWWCDFGSEIDFNVSKICFLIQEF